MANSLKLLTAALCIGSLSACSSHFQQTSPNLDIKPWSQPLPQRVLLIEYRAGSDFRQEVRRSEQVQLQLLGNDDYLRVELLEYNQLRYDADYILQLDGKLEFRISELRGGRILTPYQLVNMQINDCHFGLTHYLYLPLECGQTIK